MKKLHFLNKIFWLFMTLSAIAINSYGENPATTDVGVLIDGTKWATRNIEEKGLFVFQEHLSGNFYTWEDAQIACPTGWRLPTKEEFESLKNADNTWTTQDGVAGRILGDGSDTIFLPAIGHIHYKSGRLWQAGAGGYYWSGTPGDESSIAYSLYFCSGNTGVNTVYRTYGQSVRCVADE